MNELKISKTVYAFTFLLVVCRFFYQGDLKPVNWQRAERKLLNARIESSKSKKAGELSLVVTTNQGRIILNVSQIHRLDRCVKGNNIKAKIKVYPLTPGVSNSRELYDYLLFRQGVVARAWADNFSCVGEKQKAALGQRIFYNLQKKYGDSDVLSVLVAMNLGVSEILSEGVKELFADLGLSHILVVSGYHIGLVYSFFFIIADYLFSRSVALLRFLPSEYIATPIALIAANYFCFITDFAAPCLRALVFLYLTIACKFYGSSAGSLHRLLLVVCLIVIFDSSALFDLSFLLSVAAVMGVICGVAVARKNKIISFFTVSVFAWTFTLPLCLLFFNKFVPLALFFNLTLLPFLTFFFSIIGFPLLLIGISNIKHVFGVYLRLLDVIYQQIWQIHEKFDTRTQILEYELALKIALIIVIINILAMILIYKKTGKKNHDLLQLAQA